jgi:hypothetical protein
MLYTHQCTSYLISIKFNYEWVLACGATDKNSVEWTSSAITRYDRVARSKVIGARQHDFIQTANVL